MKQYYAPSELIINEDGSVFHLHVRPEWLADKVILVGDPGRVDLVARHFTEKECDVQSREFHTVTGTYKDKRITVVSTGIGCDNIDIVLNELDALANIDFQTRQERDTLRRLSHRRFAAEAGRFLGEQIDYPFPQLPVELHTPDEVRAFTEQNERKVLKAPWSGSGRGLYWNLYGYDTALAQWSNGALQKQGVLMGEPVYDKIDDWAMEFFSDGSRAVFAGYSSFLTDSHGAYKENRLADNDSLERELADAVGMGIIAAVKQALTEFFTTHVAPHYTGYFGIDMMTYRDSQGIVRLHPFVEINLRMNMGMVARKIADRFLEPGKRGIYRVDYFPKVGELYHDHIARQAQYPIQIIDGKFRSGYFALTPVLPHSRYRASIEIYS